MKSLLVLSFFFGLGTFHHSASAQAVMNGVVFSPSILAYSYDDKDNNSTVSKVSAQFIDVRLGYLAETGLYIGGIYSQMKRKDGNTNRERTSLGVGGGFVYSQFFLLVHYYLSSDFDISSTETLDKGKGFQADLGYWFNLAGPFFFGPQITYRTIEYDKKNGVGVNDSDSTEVIPYLSFAVIF